MIENLVIVESPAKAKTIERFLGEAYTVKSSFGHIRDLEKKNLKWRYQHPIKIDYGNVSDITFNNKNLPHWWIDKV